MLIILVIYLILNNNKLYFQLYNNKTILNNKDKLVKKIVKTIIFKILVTLI